MLNDNKIYLNSERKLVKNNNTCENDAGTDC
jgi:hypothetical protein